jgi:pilus assembly protein CpaB
MNLTRIIVLCVALIAAGAAVLVVRGMLGGGPAAVQASVPPPQSTTDVLVAAKDIGAGRALSVDAVRWEAWPKSSVSDAFVVKNADSDIQKVVMGVVVRTPLVAGQPVTQAAIVHSDTAGFMAAMLSPGMRAVSITISAETSAGGFILPNDRVDVILTRDVSEGGGGGKKAIQAETILRDVRVLAIDQSAEQPKDAQFAVGKTATVEVTPGQSELIEESRMMGALSLALRPLGEDSMLAGADVMRQRGSGMNVIRYGVARSGSSAEGGRVQ